MDTATTRRRVGKTDSWREVEDGPDKWLSEAVADRRCERASRSERLRARLGFSWALGRGLAWELGRPSLAGESLFLQTTKKII